MKDIVKLSSQNAYKLFESGKIAMVEIGTLNGLLQIHKMFKKVVCIIEFCKVFEISSFKIECLINNLILINFFLIHSYNNSFLPQFLHGTMLD